MANRLSLKFEKVSDGPEAPHGYTFVTATVSTGGKGLFLFVENFGARDVHATETRGIGIFPKPRMPEARAFKLYVVSSAGSRWIDIPPLDVSFPHVELFPDGRILLAGSRCQWRGPEDFDRNGAIIDPETGKVDRILLGDGIRDIAVDERGRIWASYFDEGVFGNFGWGHPGPPGPGSGGLVCFDASGEILWRFNREGAAAFIVDCYAMYASRSLISIFFYSDFQVCEVNMDFTQSICTPNQITGSGALVASNRAFLFSSQYGEARDKMHLILRKESELEKPQPVFVEWPKDFTDIGRTMGRGEAMHTLNQHGWFRAELAKLVADAL
jgi:hypothetical protein